MTIRQRLLDTLFTPLIIQIDRQMVITSVNEAGTEYLGHRSANEITGHPLNALVPEASLLLDRLCNTLAPSQRGASIFVNGTIVDRSGTGHSLLWRIQSISTDEASDYWIALAGIEPDIAGKLDIVFGLIAAVADRMLL